MRCPGQDMRNWKPGDIFEIECPYCGGTVEFFKDEPIRRCPACEEMVPNPRIETGCAAHCPSAAECLGEMKRGPSR